MGAEQSTMSCGELLAGCMPPPRSMYDAKKTDAYQPDSEGQPLHRMKARANNVSVSGDGNGHTIMLAPGVEFIAKHKVYSRALARLRPTPKELIGCCVPDRAEEDRSCSANSSAGVAPHEDSFGRR
jgi:hypothetical protein